MCLCVSCACVSCASVFRVPLCFVCLCVSCASVFPYVYLCVSVYLYVPLYVAVCLHDQLYSLYQSRDLIVFLCPEAVTGDDGTQALWWGDTTPGGVAVVEEGAGP